MQRKANRGKFVFFCTVVPLNLIVFPPLYYDIDVMISKVENIAPMRCASSTQSIVGRFRTVTSVKLMHLMLQHSTVQPTVDERCVTVTFALILLHVKRYC